jgi:fructose-1,6-bisphosphatase II / sedoheptulose-1,7-bisphosphatase
MNKLQYAIEEITVSAALSCYPFIGKGLEKEADQAAVNSIRNSLAQLPIQAEIAVGEGERDKAPMLYAGEIIGDSEIKIDVAVDPLEGTSICANNGPDSMSVMAIAKHGTILKTPDLYMEKIAIGPGFPHNTVDLDKSLEENLFSLAKAKEVNITDLNVCILDRERHAQILNTLRKIAVKVTIIGDGDVLGCLKTCLPNGGVDMYIGIGGAPEGILAAAGLKCLGGQIQGRLIFDNEEQIKRAKNFGITDLHKKYAINDMIKDDVLFSATWITNGYLSGIRKLSKDSYKTSTLLMLSNPKTMKIIESTVSER